MRGAIPTLIIRAKFSAKYSEIQSQSSIIEASCVRRDNKINSLYMNRFHSKSEFNPSKI